MLIKIVPFAITGVIVSIIAFKIYKARKAMLNNKRIKKIYKICKRQKINNDIKTINCDKLKPIINQQKWQLVAPPFAKKKYSNYNQNRNL